MAHGRAAEAVHIALHQLMQLCKGPFSMAALTSLWTFGKHAPAPAVIDLAAKHRSTTNSPQYVPFSCPVKKSHTYTYLRRCLPQSWMWTASSCPYTWATTGPALSSTSLPRSLSIMTPWGCALFCQIICYASASCLLGNHLKEP